MAVTAHTAPPLLEALLEMGPELRDIEREATVAYAKVDAQRQQEGLAIQFPVEVDQQIIESRQKLELVVARDVGKWATITANFWCHSHHGRWYEEDETERHRVIEGAIHGSTAVLVEAESGHKFRFGMLLGKSMIPVSALDETWNRFSIL